MAESLAIPGASRMVAMDRATGRCRSHWPPADAARWRDPHCPLRSVNRRGRSTAPAPTAAQHHPRRADDDDQSRTAARLGRLRRLIEETASSWVVNFMARALVPTKQPTMFSRRARQAGRYRHERQQQGDQGGGGIHQTWHMLGADTLRGQGRARGNPGQHPRGQRHAQRQPRPSPKSALRPTPATARPTSVNPRVFNTASSAVRSRTDCAIVLKVRNSSVNSTAMQTPLISSLYCRSDRKWFRASPSHWRCWSDWVNSRSAHR